MSETDAAGDHAGQIRVFLVDDQQMVRAGFRMLVESQDDMVVVGEAGDGGEALERLTVTTADVVLMDVRMPRLDGVETTRRLLATPEAPRVIVLTTFDLDEYAFAAIRAGASAFLLKDAAPPDLLGAIRAVRAGDAVVAPSTTRRLLDHFAALPDPAVPATSDDRLALLTERERGQRRAVALEAAHPQRRGIRCQRRRRAGAADQHLAAAGDAAEQRRCRLRDRSRQGIRALRQQVRGLEELLLNALLKHVRAS